MPALPRLSRDPEGVIVGSCRCAREGVSWVFYSLMNQTRLAFWVQQGLITREEETAALKTIAMLERVAGRDS